MTSLLAPVQTDIRGASILGPEPIAVIDIGSNSSRVVVLRLRGRFHLEVLADAQSSLRLVRELDTKGKLGAKASARVATTVAGFKALAQSAGATRVVAAATAAMREAADGPALIARLRDEIGVEVRMITGAEEAEFAFAGAIGALPVEHGLLADIGGGSMQLAYFRDRRMQRAWTLSLGALRLSGRFLASDPPAPPEVRRLIEYVRESLKDARVPKLRDGEVLVGTGGTFRNLAKIDRRARPYPLTRLHGYVLTSQRLAAIGTLLAQARASERESIPGLNRDRQDSIVGGALAARAVLEAAGAKSVVIAGEGLREGLALSALGRPIGTAEDVRRDSLAVLCGRFGAWDRDLADRRVALARRLLYALDEAAGEEQQATLDAAARVLDIGRSVDYYNRHEHAAHIVGSTDLRGFSHRAIALLSATVLLSGQPNADLKQYRPLLTGKDNSLVGRLAVVLELADGLVHRLLPGQEGEVQFDGRDGQLSVRLPTAPLWTAKNERERVKRQFGRELVFRAAKTEV